MEQEGSYIYYFDNFFNLQIFDERLKKIVLSNQLKKDSSDVQGNSLISIESLLVSRNDEYFTVNAPQKGVLLFDLRNMKGPIFNNFKNSYSKYGKSINLKDLKKNDLINYMHPTIKTCLIDPNSVLNEDPSILADIGQFLFTNHLQKKCLILKSKDYILRTKNYFKIEVISMLNGENVNTILFPGFVLDFMQNDKGTIIVLGCNSNGNFVCQFDVNQTTTVKSLYSKECFFLEDSFFLHRIHDIGKEKFLAHNLFHYSIQKFD
jgi:hypothetical protein